MVASNDNTSVIRNRFLGADFANYFGVCDFFVAVGRNGIVVDNEEGVGVVDAFAGGFRFSADALAEAAQFVRV